MDDLTIDEKINGYYALVNIKHPNLQTKYPYNQLNVINVKFTQNTIEIIAKDIEDNINNNINNEKKGGYKTQPTLIYF